VPSGTSLQTSPSAPGPAASALPNDPAYPDAKAVLPPVSNDSPVIESTTQTYRAGVYVLEGNVVITSGTRRVQADHVEYHADTGDLMASGHVIVTGGENDERMTASRGSYNLKTGTGVLYDVVGSVGVRAVLHHTANVYTTGNPFLFTGRIVRKTGPRDYEIEEGSVTSCQLPKPDWILSAAHISMDADKARAKNSTFHVLSVPILYLPYVTHPVDSQQRQSGLLPPTIGQSNVKGLVLGEQIYLTLGRTADMVLGADYYSSIGFAQNAAFRYRGNGLDVASFHYTGVLDRRSGTANQGGEDAVMGGRHDFNPQTRTAGNVEYLSSYTYREAFSNNFNQAVDSDIISNVFLAHEHNGIEYAGLADRYQGIKVIATPTTPQEQVRIFHAPELALFTTDHRLGNTPFELSVETSADGLKHTQPNFVTSGIVERFDLHPTLSLPFTLGTLHLEPSLGARETAYSRSRAPMAPAMPGIVAAAPMESLAAISRSDFEFELAVRPPVIERTFHPEGRMAFLGSAVRHTIEPELTYRLVKGIHNFSNLLRFDDIDVASNTNELEYGVTQRLFRRVRRRVGRPCTTDADFASGLNPAPNSDDGLPGDGTDSGAGQGGSAAAGTSTGLAPGGLAAGDADTTDTTAADAMQPIRVVTNTSSSVGVPGVGAGPARGVPPPDPCGEEEMISWTLAQKYFFDSTFGNAVVDGRRNIFQTTLQFSGVAFLTEPRDISPLISRLRVRTSAATDVEWDFDLDTGAKKFTSSNVFIDLHRGDFFTALSYARLDAPGRFYTEQITDAATTGITSLVSDFNQVRYLIGYGNPAKGGLSLAANTGLDLKSLYGATSTRTVNGVTTSQTVYPALFQYAAVQAGYNWNCCGLAIEYRKFELGSVRNENSYRFNFTLANIGSAGNLRRAERLF
jgi:LPS-assembly protein